MTKVKNISKKTKLKNLPSSIKDTSKIPLIVLGNAVLFPKSVVSIIVSKPKSLQALSQVSSLNSTEVLCVAQKKFGISDHPTVKDIFSVGVLANIIQIIPLPNDSSKILIEVLHKVELLDISDSSFFEASYSIVQDFVAPKNTEKIHSKISHLLELFKEYWGLSKNYNVNMLDSLSRTLNPEYMLNIILSNLKDRVKEKQKILEEREILKKYNAAIKLLMSEIAQNNVEQSIQKKMKTQIEKVQRNFYLNEQLKAIKNELNYGKSEFYDLEEKIRNLDLPEHVREKGSYELKKLQSMNHSSYEFSMIKGYLDVLLGMPWSKTTKKDFDISIIEKKLDEKHFGLKNVKERIFEYLAVLKRSDKIKGAILCLIGPPGVGKTSLVQSIAKAMGYKYGKFSLGGVHDESEIRGHRKTYVGAMPGKIVGLIKKAQVDNPIILLDEIDKIVSGARGDPTSALLEVLDPEQNAHFTDNYLEVEYDLSQVIFVATANSDDIPRALYDRLEILRISGYLEEEKLCIAKEYLIKKQLSLHMIQKSEFDITKDAILDIVRYYTRESGVRELDRAISKISRKVLMMLIKCPKKDKITVNKKNLKSFLGVKRYKFGSIENKDKIASTTALAYTELGGDLLRIEAAFVPGGKGLIKATGRLGDVMKESVETAYSCVLSNLKSLDIDFNSQKEQDIHLHVPEGGIPKDGPSAGIAIYTTIVSLMRQKFVKKDIAMTGEITLHGKILPIGGLKEKLLAARRGGVREVLIPEGNIKDLEDIPNTIKKNIIISSVSNIVEVVERAFIE